MIPSARRLMASLRHIGYHAPAAVSDLIDNSIDADARSIKVDVVADGSESWVRIADDGIGMTARELDEAMRYGSSRPYKESDLGAFGLGLKTASLSQCRRLTVASKTTERGRVEVRRWDLDRVAAHDSWALQRLTPRQCPDHLITPLTREPGTVVLWERLDRVLDYRKPDGAAATNSLNALGEEIREHIAMVFHRFLAGELSRGRRRIRLWLNGERVVPWDPFARTEPLTQQLPVQVLLLSWAGRRHRVRIRPYVLPSQMQFSTPDAHALAGGPRRWNRQQGLYIYRRDRLIQSGGWNRLRTTDEHSKLARIAVDIPPKADSAFEANISKMSVAIPRDLRAELRTLASGVVQRAQDTYRQRMRLVHDADGAIQDPTREATATDAVWTPVDAWPVITHILERELGHDPPVLRRVLVALANADLSRQRPAVGSP
jgi:hypothetical protein